MLGRYVTGQIKMAGLGSASERYVTKDRLATLNWGNVIGSGSGPWVLGREREQAQAAADFVKMVKRARGS